MMSTSNVPTTRNIFIDIFAICFGIGAWLSVNGLWVELPLLVAQLPESWSLPSYMTIFTQLANIATIFYAIIYKCWPLKITETVGILVIMCIGIASCVLLVIFWDRKLYVFGELHSVGLLTLVSFLSIVDCTSSIVFIPFMAKFSGTYLVSYFIGEGLSGFIPSVVALAQGVGGNPKCMNESNGTGYLITLVIPEPNFSVETFMYIILVMMCSSLIGFVILKVYPWPNCYLANHLDSPGARTSASTEHLTTVNESSSESPQPVTSILKMKFHMVLTVWINFYFNGVLMSIQSFSCLPYGNIAYHLSVTISNAANPVFCSIAFWKPNYNPFMLSFVTGIGSLVGVYVLILAIMSPSPPFIGTTFGTTVLVFAWTLITGLMSHTKTSIAMELHKGGNYGLFWYGTATQFGSLVGSILMAVLVNVFNLFKSYSPC